MAEKKFGWGTVLLASGAAGLVAGGVVAYLKREELKKFAEDIMTRVKPENEDGDLFEYETDSGEEEEEIERDIVLTEEDDEDDEPADVENEIITAEEDDGENSGEDAKTAPADAAGEE